MFLLLCTSLKFSIPKYFSWQISMKNKKKSYGQRKANYLHTVPCLFNVFNYRTCHKDFYFTFAWNAIDWIGKRKLPHDGGGKPFDLYTEDNTKIDEDFFSMIGNDIIVRLSTGTDKHIADWNVNISGIGLFLPKTDRKVLSNDNRNKN